MIRWRLITPPVSILGIAFRVVVSTATAADWPVTNAAAISAAAKQAAAGDTITLADGVWTDQRIVFRGQGSAHQPITLRAQTPGRVILDGASQLRLAGEHLIVEGLWFQNPAGAEDVIEFRTHRALPATNCLLRACAITAVAAGPRAENRWVSLYGVSNRVEQCCFSGKTSRGTTLVVWVETNRPNHHVIARNHFGPRPRLGLNGGETLRVGSSAESMFNSRTLVASNLFDRCNGEVEIVSNKSCENEYRANTFIACEGALTLRHGNRCRVEGNFFLGRGQTLTGGIRIIGEDHVVTRNYLDGLRGHDARSALTLMNGVANSRLNGYFRVQRAEVSFNTVIDCAHPLVIGLADGGGQLAPIDCVITRNVIHGTRTPLVRLATAPVNLRWEANRMSGAKVGVASPGIVAQEMPGQRGSDGVWRAVGSEPISSSPLQPPEVGPDWLPPAARQ